MKKGFFNFFLAAYENESMEIRRKTKGFLVGSIILTVLIAASMPTLLVTTVDAGSLVTLTVLAVSIGIVVFALVLLKRNKPNAAVFIFSYLSPIVIFFIFFASTSNLYELGRLTATSCVIIALVSLVAMKRGQIIVYAIETVLMIAVFFTLKIFTLEWPVNGDAIQEIITDEILFLVCTGFILVAFNIVQERMRLTETELKRDREQISRVNALLGSAKDSINIGAALASKTALARQKINEINRDVTAIAAEIIGLSSVIESFSGVIREIVAIMTSVLKTSDDYSAVVSETTSAVEQMTTSIRNISSVSRTKKVSLSALVGSINNVEQESEKAVLAINEIAKQSGALFEIVNVINGVATQTDMLAMNAAIQAAHAGEAGKGFSVVADEIRTLAEETNNNLHIISDTLRKNVADIDTAKQLNENTARSFSATKNDIVGVDKAIGEIINGMDEISTGTNEILSGASSVNKLSTEVAASVREAEVTIHECGANLREVNSMIDKIMGKITTITENASLIASQIAGIDEAGAKNSAQIEKLTGAIESLQQISNQ